MTEWADCRFFIVCPLGDLAGWEIPQAVIAGAGLVFELFAVSQTFSHFFTVARPNFGRAFVFIRLHRMDVKLFPSGGRGVRMGSDLRPLGSVL